ncbi:MAG: ATP-dependent helicase [Tissierellia bacterium]|nr:ATP-dependent helicase [Tissierellia bacterium]
MNFSDEQMAASKHLKGPALVLAVPGAGKTSIIIERTYNLINSGIKPHNILSLTFSKAAANEMKYRFDRKYNTNSNYDIRFSTIHAFCFLVIREYSRLKNVEYKLLESDKGINKIGLIKEIYKKVNKDYITEDKLESLLNGIGYCKNMMIDYNSIPKDLDIDIDNFDLIFKQYEDYKQKYKYIDFDDMLTLSYEILKREQYLRNKFVEQYQYIQIDEGQDTSKIQMAIINLLAKKYKNLFIVADDDQSIYGFRGAFPKGLFELKEIYPNLKIFYMQRNYRSTKNIVSASNKFIKQNSIRYEKELIANKDFAEPIDIIRLEESVDQYDYIFNQIPLLNGGSTAILYRNNLSAIGLVEYFERNDISFSIRDNKLKFFNHWIINDITNILNIASKPSDIGSYENIYYKLKGYISKKHIQYIWSNNIHGNIFTTLLNYPNLSHYYKNNIRELSKDFEMLNKMKPHDALVFIEQNLDYRKYLKENARKLGNTYDSLRTIYANLKLIAKSTDTIEEFYGRLKELEYLVMNSKDRNASITFTTIHSAKGREFDNVFIIDLVDGTFPNLNALDNKLEKDNSLFEEERRLFYVAITRAKSKLTLLFPKRLLGERVEASTFIHELMDECK